MCVADGHGGTSFFANYVTKHIRFILNSMLRSSNPDIQDVIKRCVATLQRMVNSAARKKSIVRGGATFTICIIDEASRLAYFGNLGDSLGFVFRMTSSGRYTIGFRTIDHDARSPVERERIMRITPRARFSGYYLEIDQDQIMTVGGFGDYKFGSAIRRIPQVYEPIQLGPGDVVAVMSDGYGEELSNNKLVPERNEDEIAQDLSAAFYHNENIGYSVTQRKIERLANKMLEARRVLKTPQNIQQMSTAVQGVMDNHIGLFYPVQHSTTINTTENMTRSVTI
jgi:serine/threonine protein phosphatase PrpC